MAKKVCMYCGATYGTVSGPVDSHGPCPKPACQERLRRDLG